MTLVQWTTHSINAFCKAAKQVNKNNKEVGWQQKEASYIEACSEKGEGGQLVAHCAKAGP